MPDGERVFGPGPYTLLCDGRPVAPAAVAETSATRRRGLLRTDRVEGALWITRCPSVHMIGMRYPIDVAVVDREGTVLLTKTISPWTGGTWFAAGLRHRRGAGRRPRGLGRRARSPARGRPRLSGPISFSRDRRRSASVIVLTRAIWSERGGGLR